MSRKKNVLKVVLIGDSHSGKTSLMERFKNSSFNELLKATVAIDVLEKDVTVDGETYTLQIWDTAGQERYRSLTKLFYKGSDICLLTFALDDERSFDNLSQWKDDFFRNADIPNGMEFPFVIVGNKVDNVNTRRVDNRKARSWCSQNGGFPYYETSAKDATNVDKAFIAALERYIELRKPKRYIEIEREGLYMEPPGSKGSTVDLTKKPKKKSGCC